MIYNSLNALVKAEYPFDDALQDRAAQFLKSLEPKGDQKEPANKLITELVPSSAGSTSGFIDSVVTLLSSPHSTVVAAALSFLHKTTNAVSPAIRCCLVESDLIGKVLETIQPHTLPISENEVLMGSLLGIIIDCIKLAFRSNLGVLGVTKAVNKSNHREMNFQKVVLPSSQFLTFLISNRHILNTDLSHSFMSLLRLLLHIGPFNRPILEFILASPIVMANSSCLSFVEHDQTLWFSIGITNRSLKMWKENGPEVAQSAKRMRQALFSEGFEDTLEQMMKHEKSGI
ncbi:hypothetical protein BLNAU_21619 [Blattamonas nauphoetae]|uniref:Uncharacterized protein n=1 Tax=Blattamonas nauphoetae TaxID=2049346 RepID=A0ABQ9WYF2_9EUKA|nr:hypothetical protein BLNAU_21619 [Blattamonas nauphoetae]